MEFNLNSYDGALPVEVTLDEDNGRYMIRKSDTSGEFFNNPMEMVKWIRNNLKPEDFCIPAEFTKMMSSLSQFE
ncbi:MULTISPECIES: hypothetical protein [Mesobacillus]|uniref:Threonine dehydratase n=2 Tax=Mesobacillus TaxID=2675231 RepID=A0A0D6ZCF1_9BACI|nr:MULTISPECIES: hypothetical protein [Mesobacillus]KIY22253.1 threonine dehydratase [Mesobacillus subterraneus]MDQ0412013.1 hypothetical protein [Mesobacillus stamsii]